MSKEKAVHQEPIDHEKQERQELKKLILQHAKGQVVLSRLLRTFGRTDPAFVLLLGAGASHSSGIPTAGEMIDEWKQHLFLEKKCITAKGNEELFDAWSKTEYRDWRKHWAHETGNRTDYSLLFSYFYDQRGSRQRHIEELIDGKVPTMGYVYLAGLVFSGFFNRILTTNFDELVSDALSRYYDVRSYSLAFDSALSSIRLDSPRPKVFKLHGDFLYDNVRNLRHELTRLDALMEEKMFRLCAETGLLVVGYGGKDASVMGPIHEMLRRGEYLKLGIHWCIQKTGNELDPEVPDAVLDLVEEFPGRVHVYLINGFDELMEDIYDSCAVEMAPRLLDSRNQNLVLDLITCTRKFGGPLKTNKTNVFLHDFGSNLAKGSQKFITEVVLADNLWGLGRSYQQQHQYDDAMVRFREAAQLIEKALDRSDATTAPLGERLLAHGRATGIFAGLAEEEQRRKIRTWVKQLDKLREHASRSGLLPKI